MIKKLLFLAVFAVLMVSVGMRQKKYYENSSTKLVIHEYQSHLDQTAPFDADTIIFTPQETKFVRMMIHSTLDGLGCCFDEIEIVSPESKRNIALASTGAIARSSSAYANHETKHLNDGKYGNDHSWIAGNRSFPQWVEIEMPKIEKIEKIIVSRDREGKFHDRKAKKVEVLLSNDGKGWTSVTNVKLMNPFQFPVSKLEQDRSWEALVRYSFLCERDSWLAMPKDDYLTPSLSNRPAIPGGTPYWGYIAALSPSDRALVQFEEMIERFDKKGMDVTRERTQMEELRKKNLLKDDDQGYYLTVRQAKRDLFLRDPDLSLASTVLFAKRNHYLESHNYSEHLDGVLKPGGGVYMLNIPSDANGRLVPEKGLITELFNASDGIAREPVLNHKADKIYFSYRPDKPSKEGWESYWNLYEMNSDGSDLRQLTSGAFHDFDPVCLPGGGIAFISTRNKSRFLCWRPQAYVLYRMDKDGSNIKRLSHANLSEWNPSVMKDGRIMWTRSEYLDKGSDFGHTLWAIRPDGTQPELIFGNNTPNCYGQAHEVPGTNELVSVLISHGNHDGPIALINLSKANNDVEAITNITPDTRPCYQMDRDYARTFRNPYPLSSDYFIVSHNPDMNHHYSLYIIDRYGNRELIYCDPLISSMHPTPLFSRELQYILPQVVLRQDLADQQMGQFTVQDVYIGLGDEVKRGSAKYIRVSREMPSVLDELSDGQCRADHDPFQDYYATPVYLVQGPPTSFLTRTPNAHVTLVRTYSDWKKNTEEIEPGLYRITEQGGWAKGTWASYVAKQSLGTVPIEADGSANFIAPANQVLYFHLLDSAYNEIQRMRSVIQLQPGEIRSCVGCHEDRRMAPPVIGRPLANMKNPRLITPDPSGDTPFSYEKTIQPILDNSCVKCHNGTKPNRPVFIGTRGEDRVPVSFRSMIEGGYVHFFNFDWYMRHYKAEPYSFGTVQSKIWKALDDDNHKDVVLSPDDRRALKLWIDLNCPLWPDYKYRLDR